MENSAENGTAKKERFQFSLRHAAIIGILVLAFSASFLIRSQALDFGFELNEFDPFFNYRATNYLVENGLAEYLDWHDEMSWHPNGRNISATSQSMLHYTAATTYQIFGMGSSLYDFTIIFPVVFGSLTCIVIFALVRVIGGTNAGLVAALLFSISVPIVIRGLVGWFKSEPLGLFFGLLGAYLLLSGIKTQNRNEGALRLAGAGLFMAFGLASWGGIQFFLMPLGVFFLALPFLRDDHRFQTWSIPIFTTVLMMTSLLFERPGLSFVTGISGFTIVGPTVFLVACNVIQSKSPVGKKFRNGILLLAGVLAAGISIIALSFSTSLLNIPSYRYLNAVNPFLTTTNPLTDSVSEHATTTLEQSFFFLSIMMVFAGIGAWLIFHDKKLSSRQHRDVMAFALIIGITGVYVSSSFIRLEVFASISVIILSSIGISRLIENISAREPGIGLPFKSALIGGIVILFVSPLVIPAEGNWIDSVKIPPTILNGGTALPYVAPDWPSTLSWISANTPQDSIIAAWWDYGYWITAIGERTSLVDNATMDTEAIQNVARMLLANPDDSWRMLQEMNADYVVTFVMSQAVPSGGDITLYRLGGGGDESKKYWFVRIAEEPLEKYMHADGVTGNDYFWNETMLGQMFPYVPIIYIDPVAGAQSESYVAGYTPLYVKSVKLPSDGDGPLRLAYASPTFNDGSQVSFGVFVYEVNDDYVLKD